MGNLTPTELTAIDQRVAEALNLDPQIVHGVCRVNFGESAIGEYYQPTINRDLGYEVWEEHKRKVYHHLIRATHSANPIQRYIDWYLSATLPDLMLAVVEAMEADG